jgi:hypothetical protein
MEQLHALVWTLVEDLSLVPPRPVLETLCCIRQQRTSWTSQQPEIGDDAQNKMSKQSPAQLDCYRAGTNGQETLTSLDCRHGSRIALCT